MFSLPLLILAPLHLLDLFLVYHAASCDWLIPPNEEGSDWLAGFGWACIAFAFAATDSLPLLSVTRNDVDK